MRGLRLRTRVTGWEVPVLPRSVEEEKAEDQVEDESFFRQDIPTRKNSELNERIENLEVQVQKLCNIVQGNNEQDADQSDEEQAVNDGLSLPDRGKSRLQEQIEDHSQIVLRMGLEINRLSVSQVEE